MKKLLMVVGAIFISTFAIAHTINWHVGDQIISTTTCNSGDNITPPTASSKRGYHLKEWSKALYIRLEYIESTGIQYINTPLKTGDGTFEYECDFMPTSFVTNNSYTAIFGVNGNYQAGITDSGIANIGNASSPNNTYFTLNQKSRVSGVVSTVEHYTYYYVDGVDTGLHRATNSVAVNQLFAASGDHYVKGRMYFFRATRNGLVIFDAIPVKRISDNAIGMYDTVTNTFFTNQGTGDFVAGPEVGGL